MMESKNPKIWMEINGTPISWSFRQSVITFCKNDHEAARVFYRCEAAGAKNPMAWIRAGLRGEQYAMKRCKDEFDNPKAVQEWIKAFWDGNTEKSIQSLREIFKGL